MKFSIFSNLKTMTNKFHLEYLKLKLRVSKPDKNNLLSQKLTGNLLISISNAHFPIVKRSSCRIINTGIQPGICSIIIEF